MMIAVAEDTGSGRSGKCLLSVLVIYLYHVTGHFDEAKLVIFYFVDSGMCCLYSNCYNVLVWKYSFHRRGYSFAWNLRGKYCFIVKISHFSSLFHSVHS